MSQLTRSNTWVPPGEELVDPISMEMMTDPVIAADGHTYERSSIQEYFSRQDSYHRVRSPMTNDILPNLHLIPNHAIRGLIREYHAQNPGTAPPDKPKQEITTFEQGFQVFIRTVEGKTRVLNDVKRTHRIKQFRKMIEDLLGIPVESMRLIFAGKQLEDRRGDGVENRVDTYNIEQQSTIHVAFRLLGGN